MTLAERTRFGATKRPGTSSARLIWRKLVADAFQQGPYKVSLVGSSASNGVAERGVQTVEGQIRVLKDAFETQVGAQIPSNHNILAWLG